MQTIDHQKQKEIIIRQALLHLDKALQAIGVMALALTTVITIHCIVFIWWVYGVLTKHTIEELSVQSPSEWHQGLSTMWHASLDASAVITLIIAAYLLLRLALNKIITRKPISHTKEGNYELR